MSGDMESKLVSRQSKIRVKPEENNDFVMDIDEEKKRSKPKGFFKLLKANSMEFCRSTSLHGLRYIGETQRHVLERIFWLTAFLLSSIVAAYYIYNIWYKWNSSPVLVSFSDVQTSVWNIPFPAVTICPPVKVKKRAFNSSIISKKENLTDDELDRLQFYQVLCTDKGISDIPGNDTVDSRAIDFIEEVSPTLDEVIWMCFWGNNFTRCDRFFKSVLTDRGLCYSFNSLSSQELFTSDTIQYNSKHLNRSETLTWSLEGGYPDSEMIDTYPHRALTSGAYGGLTLIIGMDEKDIDPICSVDIQGVEVLLHNPADFPNVEDQYFRVPLNRHVIVGIRPRLTFTSDRLRGYPPEKRQCYYATERLLRYFNIYTQTNCDLECYTNYTLQKCGCVLYHMPPNFATDDDGLFRCKCMPACTEMSFDVETSQAKFSWLKSLKLIATNATLLEQLRLTEVSFYYKERQFLTSQRGELYGTVDFLASCGGLLGLLLGFSLLSVVEIIYFFTVRLFCNFRLNKKKHPAP